MTASLWLVPRENNPFTKTTIELITETVPSNFVSLLEGKKVNFEPHVTVTSDIDASKYGDKPQEWLDSLSLPEFKKEVNDLVLEMDEVEADDPYFRKLTIKLLKNDNLIKLAAQCRADAVDSESAQKWAETEYSPHLSLMYADIPRAEVKKKVPLIEMQIAYAIGDLFACCGGTLCMGGYLVLVDTSKPVDEWKTIAKRETPWAMWKMTRNMI
ncbi:2',3'-cyclic-nucleotide 3'-phosphodiesterase [Cyphellophora attinorum]|uniref:2',3'-cyclic-nucleotide 3'-phosphodiesterase n=1 Tax=Cyphellophora attinorum TaxID=1664694 RepID=A0A0N0NNX0_9EURO|nr:2',3'-cyclic-nucleotide 3'-phosphodiesterase [Phialophora attinorum]KPI41869.1 2',3'-cyclic-nucleotide 3'-phosphodiesterase [Phialophora attinorum]